MSVVIFSGPTISPDEVAGRIDAVCLPPVSQGDICRAMDLEPRAIGIIDGYFHGVPSAWHKEILWALSQGVRVFGSASMGALRAAELDDMGMTGVGRIFEDFKAGFLEDDDEVAVQHGPQELGFPVLGVPMVNLRATVARALDEGVVEADFAEQLVRFGKATFYKDRTWDVVLNQMEGDKAAFRAWLESGYVDQKRIDAEAMLAEMQSQLDAGLVAPVAGEPFEWTLVWQRLLDEKAARDDTDGDILDELRLLPELFIQLRGRARVRSLVLGEVDVSGAETISADRVALKKALRERFCLLRQADFTDWLARNDLPAGVLDGLLAEEAECLAVLDEVDRALGANLIAEAKLDGHFEALKKRAADKASAIGKVDRLDPALARCGLLSVQLVQWYFRDRLGRDAPAQAAEHAREHGFASLEDFHECLAREFIYAQVRDKNLELP